MRRHDKDFLHVSENRRVWLKPFALNLVVWICAVITSSCLRSNPPETANPDLNRYNWWNYYRQGLAAMEQSRYDEAQELLESAVGIRPGARTICRRDSWKERTYGLHMQENYFPYRELGICRFHQGNFEQAEHYLEESLSQEPSGRAKFYLNLTRRERLSKAPPPPPQLQWAEGSTNLWTRERIRKVQGAASGPARVARISIDNERLFYELAEERISFDKTVELAAGTNVIRITAEDLLGRQANAAINCIADWTPPCIVIAEERREGHRLLLSGTCYDNEVLAHVQAGNRVLYDHANGKDIGELSFNLSIPDAEMASIVAKDMAGNQIEFFAREDKTSVALQFQNAARLVMEGSAAGPLAGASGFQEKDRTQPVLRVTGQDSTLSVFEGEYYLDGEASDAGGLASIQVNGEEWLRTQDRGAKRMRFAGRLPLTGTNVFSVRALDREGNAVETRVTVLKKRPEYLDETYRLRTVLMPARAPEKSSWMHTDQVDELLNQSIARPPIRFRLLVRGEELKAVLHEQEISASELSDMATALRIGKLMPAELVLSGTVFNNGEGVTVYLRVIDTEQREVLYGTDVYSDKSLDELRYQLDGLVSKIEQFFPLVDTRIAECDRKKAVLAAGSGEGVHPGAKFLALDPKSSSGTGQVIKAGKQPVELRVQTVQAHSSMAEITPAGAEKLLTPGLRAVAR
ncbi:MAG TPA: hypothetical protein DCZ95_17950 [Verrucomicrobia bacterium]|nr:MAG: hypothetical protein A2X46_10725 [Lentisphaerae bacterium GWF2_57_35]HBA85971.1 hypothetical protein [Verrucomicrobiota bacterium]